MISEITRIINTPSIPKAGAKVDVMIELQNINTSMLPTWMWPGVLSYNETTIRRYDIDGKMHVQVPYMAKHAWFGNFIMPAKDVTLYCESWYGDINNVWHKDDVETKLIKLDVSIEPVWKSYQIVTSLLIKKEDIPPDTYWILKDTVSTLYIKKGIVGPVWVEKALVKDLMIQAIGYWTLEDTVTGLSISPDATFWKAYSEVTQLAIGMLVPSDIWICKDTVYTLTITTGEGEVPPPPPPKVNWWPWIIGGIVVVVLIATLIYASRKKGKVGMRKPGGKVEATKAGRPLPRGEGVKTVETKGVKVTETIYGRRKG